VPEAVAIHCLREENWQFPGNPHGLPCKQYFPAVADGTVDTRAAKEARIIAT
jgi:hypothetical protein